VRLARRPAGEGGRARAGRRVYQSPIPEEEDWGTVARIYDLEHPACRGAELRFWDDLAIAAGGDVLELAAGSGRIAVALARKGHRVTGLELSAGMLERARARTERLPPPVAARLTWVQGDMTDFDLPGRTFPLIFVAYNSFWLLDTEAAQAACLRAVARHVAPGGRFVLDVFPPTADDRLDDLGLVQELPLARHERRILRVKDYVYDAGRGVATSDVRYYAGGGPSTAPVTLLARFRYPLRLAPPDAVVALLEREGFAVEETYGSYRRGPLLADSPRAIFVSRRRPEKEP
jgi:SAM-dependent methyltransferase